MKSERVLKGKVIDIWSSFNGYETSLYLSIRLENNKTISINYSRASSKYIGLGLTLKEKTTAFFNFKKYSIIKFIQEPKKYMEISN